MPHARILIVTPQPFFEDRGTPIAVACTARALAEAGNRVTVLAFPLGRDMKLPGVTIERTANPFGIERVPIGFSAGKLALDASLINSFRRLLSEGRFDLVHAVEEAAWFAAALCPSHRVPYIYDMASAIPVELERHPVLGTRPVQALLRATERRVVSQARQVICSQGLRERVEGLGTRTPVQEWEFPSFEVPSSPVACAALRSSLNIGSDDPVVMYTGNFAGYQGVDLLVDAFARALQSIPRLVLVCVGADSEAQAGSLMARVPRWVRDRMRILPRIQRREMPLYLSMADCLASPRSSGDNLPLKIFDYLASGRPIVATRVGAHESVLGGGRAILCDTDAEALGNGIAGVFTDRAASTQMAEEARTYAREHHGWPHFSQFVNGLYDTALSR